MRYLQILMKYIFIKIVLTICIVTPLSSIGQTNYIKERIKLSHLGIKVDNQLHLSESQAKRIMNVWDSLYDIGKKQHVNNILADSIWEQLILQEIIRTKTKNQRNVHIRLHYYLGHLYHSQKHFSKSIPILKYVINHSQYLSKVQLQKTYTKLEKAYVLTNQFGKALALRKERVKLEYAKSSYDLYQDFELHELALKEFIAFERLEYCKNTVDQYKYYRVLGNLYFELDKIDSARKYYKMGLDLCNQQLDENKIPINIIINGKNSFIGLLGKCYLREGNYQKAIEYLLVDIEKSGDDTNNKIFKMIYLANAYIANKDRIKAKKYINEIDKLTKDKEDKRMILRFSELKLNYFIFTKNLDSAIIYAKKFNSLKELHNETIRKNQALLLLSNIEIEARKKDLLITKANLEKVKADKKLQQTFLWAGIIIILLSVISIVMLMIKNTEKGKSKLLIEKKNQENELLLKELHHRVKNNLQVINSLINLQKRRLENPELDKALSMVQNRIKTMSLVHQNLHQNENFKLVNLKAYVQTIAEYLKSFYHTEEENIEIIIDMDDQIEILMDRAISIGLIINEIISNSLKYAFKGKDNGRINIDLQRLHKGCQMKIKDDGIGFNPENTGSKSLGLYLIANLVKQIQGRYELENFEGTTYLIYFNP